MEILRKTSIFNVSLKKQVGVYLANREDVVENAVQKKKRKYRSGTGNSKVKVKRYEKLLPPLLSPSPSVYTPSFTKMNE